MNTPKFGIGDVVALNVRGQERTRTPGHYVITRVLPLERAYGYQYRAKNERDSHERAFDEAEIISAS